MRVLFLYPYLPSPEAAHGSARVVSSLLTHLAQVEGLEITLLCVHRPAEVPLIESVRPLCHRLVTLPRRFADDMGPLERIGEMARTLTRWLSTGWPVPVVKLRRQRIARAIAKELAARPYDLVHCEMATMGQYVESFGLVPSVLVDHEAGGTPGSEASARWREYVGDIYPRFDKVLCLSPEDAAEIRRKVQRPLELEVRPPAVAIPARPQRRPCPGRLLFFGSLEHLPNRDALAWLVDEIVPRLQREVPEAHLAVAGMADARSPLMQRAAASGAELLGFVEDLGGEIARAALVVSPVREGGGVRIKNLEALAAAAPLVTTPLGLRGLAELPHDAVASGADAEAFVALCVLGLRNAELAEATGRKGREAVARHFSFEAQARITVRAWHTVRRRATSRERRRSKSRP